MATRLKTLKRAKSGSKIYNSTINYFIQEPNFELQIIKWSANILYTAQAIYSSRNLCDRHIHRRKRSIDTQSDACVDRQKEKRGREKLNSFKLGRDIDENFLGEIHQSQNSTILFGTFLMKSSTSRETGDRGGWRISAPKSIKMIVNFYFFLIF